MEGGSHAFTQIACNVLVQRGYTGVEPWWCRGCAGSRPLAAAGRSGYTGKHHYKLQGQHPAGIGYRMVGERAACASGPGDTRTCMGSISHNMLQLVYTPIAAQRNSLPRAPGVGICGFLPNASQVGRATDREAPCRRTESDHLAGVRVIQTKAEVEKSKLQNYRYFRNLTADVQPGVRGPCLLSNQIQDE